jgi:hypothetical protein
MNTNQFNYLYMYLVQDLGIHMPIEICWNDMDPRILGATHSDGKTATVILNSRRLLKVETDCYELLDTLAHELLHVRQFQDGHLKFEPNGIVYLGQFYHEYDVELTPHQQRPWEIPALAYGKLIAKELFNTYNASALHAELKRA